MIQTCILICIWILCGLFSVINLKKSNLVVRFNLEMILLLLSCMIIFPAYEEALFRCVLKQYLKNYEYGYYINGILFGIFHVQNYLISKDIWTLLLQIASTSYLGYYLVHFETFTQAYLVHALYNAGIILLCVFYQYYLLKNNKDDDKIYLGTSNSYYQYPQTVDDMILLKYKPGMKKGYIIKKNKHISKMNNALVGLYSKKPFSMCY